LCPPGATVKAWSLSREVRALARTLPRSSEHLIHDRVKFRVGAIVYVAAACVWSAV
jgi:hypothetical protein